MARGRVRSSRSLGRKGGGRRGQPSEEKTKNNGERGEMGLREKGSRLQ